MTSVVIYPMAVTLNTAVGKLKKHSKGPISGPTELISVPFTL